MVQPRENQMAKLFIYRGKQTIGPLFSSYLDDDPKPKLDELENMNHKPEELLP